MIKPNYTIINDIILLYYKIIDIYGKQCKTLVTKIQHIEGSTEGLNMDTSLVDLTPITGRSHQLRLHLSAMNHPILGDTLYAPREVMNYAPNSRLCLHARSITFEHPVTCNNMTITSDNCDFL